MNDDKTKPGESSKPSHEAARVVIPFDIDMSAVETKLAEIERRVSDVMGKMSSEKRQESDDIIKIVAKESKQEQRQNLNDDFLSTILNEQSQRTDDKERFFRVETQDQREEESHKTMMLTSINRMTDLLRQINDVALLIYTNMQNNRNAS